MADTYQAIYDAVSSRVRNGDVGAAVSDVCRQSFDISHVTSLAVESIGLVRAEFEQTALEMRRPFVLLRPKLYPDGDQWCALYGENLQEGVCGFGETPEKAAIAFDLAWLNSKPGKVSGYGTR